MTHRIAQPSLVATMAAALAAGGAHAGTIQSSNFDAETAGSWSPPAVGEPDWGQHSGADESITISTAQAHSGPNSMLPVRSSGMNGSRPVWDIDMDSGVNVLEWWYYPNSTSDQLDWYLYDTDDTSGNLIIWGWINRQATGSDGNLVLEAGDVRGEITGLGSGQWFHLRLELDFDNQTVQLSELVSGQSVSGTFANSGSEVQSLNFFGSTGHVIYHDDFATLPEPASLALLGIGGFMVLSRRKS